MANLLILPSPLLPSMVYAPLVDALRAAGHSAELAPTAKPASPGAVAAAWRERAAGAEVLVAHSNAGLLAPLVVGEGQQIVFMDAALPPESGSYPLATGGHRALLEALADKRGLLPPWTRWWPRSAFDEILPEGLYRKVDKACPRLPLSYFEEPVTAPDGWSARHNAYLAFGVAYTDEREQARDRGWPWKAMQGAHLHLMIRPAEVAAAVVDLAER